MAKVLKAGKAVGGCIGRLYRSGVAGRVLKVVKVLKVLKGCGLMGRW